MREGMDETIRERLEPAEREALAGAVGAYLADWGWRPQGPDDRLLAACLRRTETRLLRRPGGAPVEIAIAELERDLAAWAEFVLGRERIGDSPPLLLARVAFLACGGPERWPECLLSWDLPAQMVEAMRLAVPEPTPPEAQAAMVEQPFHSWSLPRLLRPARLARARVTP